MTTLTEFLTARLDEDEADAREADGEATWRDEGTWYLEGVNHSVVGPGEVAFTHPEFVGHIARHDPARVLAEVTAKRRIVELHEDNARSAGVFGTQEEDASVETLRLLASVYADHPDYDEAWLP